jgi:hypothetical protein
MYIISTLILLLLRAIILILRYASVLKKSSTAQSLVLANTIDEMLGHYTNAHGIKNRNRNSIPKISRQKIYTKVELYGKANSIVL